MRYDSTKKIRVVKSYDPQQFEEEFNQAMDELKDLRPEIEFNHAQGLCAYIIYQESNETPETVEDEFLLEGITYFCYQCPYLERGSDKRRKTWPCKYDEYGSSRTDSMACEMIYKMVKQGKMKLGESGKLEEVQP